MTQPLYLSPSFLPMPGSTLSQVPRLQGDGMDSDTLLMQGPVLPAGSDKPLSRHANLTSSQRTTTYQKLGSKYIPHEPVRGAVKAVGNVQVKGTQNPVMDNNVAKLKKLTISPQPSASSILLQNKFSPESGPILTSIQTTMKIVNKTSEGRQVETRTMSIPVYGKDENSQPSPNQISHSISNATQRSSGQKSAVMPSNQTNKYGTAVSKPTPYIGTPLSKKSDDIHATVIQIDTPKKSLDFSTEVKTPVKTSSSTVVKIKESQVDERQVEGQDRSSSAGTVEKLEMDMKQLKADLEIQTKVNADLKKLLVASVGDDLHYKVESLIRTKAQLASEIGGYTKKMHKDYEDIDELSIQADMWRSKCTASRVLVDQMSLQTTELTDMCEGQKMALQQLMQERQQLWEGMLQTHRYLKLLRDSFDPIFARKSPAAIPNILELTHTNLLLADSIKFRLLGSIPLLNTALDAGIQNGLTPAEKLSIEMLDTNSPCSEPTANAVPRLKTLPTYTLGKMYPRFHPQVRHDNITFNCCGRCKGDIIVI